MISVIKIKRDRPIIVDLLMQRHRHGTTEAHCLSPASAARLAPSATSSGRKCCSVGCARSACGARTRPVPQWGGHHLR
jgi:hypothetical protein